MCLIGLSAPNMARLEKVITNMVDIFIEYADDQGHKRKLCKDELQAMLQKEIESADLKVGTVGLWVSTAR